MAKNKLARRAAPVARSNGLARRAGRHVVRHAKRHASDRAGSIIGVGACAALGYLDRTGKTPHLGGFEPSLVLGLGLLFGGPMIFKGPNGHKMAEAGSALCGVAAYKLAAGAPLKIAGDEGVSGDDDVSGYAGDADD